MSVALAIFIITNVAIFLGYVFIARFVVPSLNIRFRSTLFGGTAFFLLCATTHMELAAHALFDDPLTVLEFTSWHMMIIHTLQAIAVWVFTFGLYREVGNSKSRLLNLSKNKTVIKNLISDIEYLQQEAMIQENSALIQGALADLRTVEQSINEISHGTTGEQNA